MSTVAEVLAQQTADIFAQLKPLQEYVATQNAKPSASPTSPGLHGFWMEALGKSAEKWAAAPKAGQAIVISKDGTFQLIPMTAPMGAGGLLSFIENPINSLWSGMPLGSIAVGATSGMVIGEIIDGVVAPRGADGRVNFTNTAVKGGAVLVLGMWGKTLMSGAATTVAVGLLVAEILADVLPLNQWIQQLVAWIRKLFGMGTTTTAQEVHQVNPPGGSFNQQRNDLYAGIFGGN